VPSNLVIPFRLELNWVSRKKKSAVGLDGKGVRPDELIHTGLIHLETRAVSVCENPPERVEPADRPGG